MAWIVPGWLRALAQGVGWRVVTVGFAGSIAVAITALAYLVSYMLHVGDDPTTSWGAILAAWDGGLALFAVVGGAVAIVSLIPPETESFDARARILFHGQSGPHIDYIVTRLTSTLEQYAELTERGITILDYNETEGKYLVQSTTSSLMKSFISDAQSSRRTEISAKKCVPHPAGARSSRIVYVRRGGDAVETAFDFVESFRREFLVVIPPGGSQTVDTQYECWVHEGDDPINHTPIRFSKHFKMTLENLLNRPLHFKLALRDGPTQEIVMPPMTERVIAEVISVEPDQRLFTILLLPA